MDLSELELHPRILDGVKKAKLTCPVKILSLSAADLQRQTKLSSKDVKHLLREVALSIPRIPVASALDIHEGKCHPSLTVQTLTTGCKVLDEFLRGGIVCPGITEIAGESAAGKTQLCMQLCLTAQLPHQLNGLDAGVAYICTEDVFPNKRLYQMIQNFQQRLDPDVVRQLSLGDHIYIEHASDQESLWQCITQRIPILLKRGMIKFVIVDSVAALFRGEYDVGEMATRARHLRSLGAFLHKLCYQYHIPIVCVNQVTANIAGRSEHCGQDFIPALGLTWSNIVTCRLLLSRTNMTLDDTVNTGGLQSTVTVRIMQAMFAPHLPRDFCYFVVESQGVRGLLK
ncbi:DNA repair protein XRCC3-like [Glandiceps talaboti]